MNDIQMGIQITLSQSVAVIFVKNPGSPFRFLFCSSQSPDGSAYPCGYEEGHVGLHRYDSPDSTLRVQWAPTCPVSDSEQPKMNLNPEPLEAKPILRCSTCGMRAPWCKCGAANYV